MGEIHELFVLAPVFGLVCRGDSWFWLGRSMQKNSQMTITMCSMSFLMESWPWSSFLPPREQLFRGTFFKGGTLTRGNDIRVTPGMTVRWHSAPCAPPLYCHAIVAQNLVVPWQRRWCRSRMTVQVSRHHCGKTVYLSPGCRIPPLPLPPP